MLRSIKQLYKKKLDTSDGDIGRVKDFYFSDQQWGCPICYRGHRYMAIRSFGTDQRLIDLLNER
jgi:hypothetical protein